MKFTDENTQGYDAEDLDSLNEMWDRYRPDESYDYCDDQALAEKILAQYDSSVPWDLGDPLH
jgi:hypothetical protein